VASPLDPLIFRISSGRFTCRCSRSRWWGGSPASRERRSSPTTPTATTSWSWRARWGQEKHPGWRYNLEAHPDVEVRVRGASFPARAEALDRDEKARYWPAIKRTIPQMATYERRTDRDTQSSVCAGPTGALVALDSQSAIIVRVDREHREGRWSRSSGGRAARFVSGATMRRPTRRRTM
jgi:deazaflavin-dependent oxidoreductase (nitroreductase family)